MHDPETGSLLLLPIAFGAVMGVNDIADFAPFNYIPVALVTILRAAAPVFSLGLSRLILGVRVCWIKVRIINK